MSPAPRRLVLFFGALYFIQGVAEPTEGLIAQPVRSLLRSWGHDAAQISIFSALLSVPWMVKPLYGLLTDFVPLWGTRRKGWLLLWTLATSVALVLLWSSDLPTGNAPLLLLLLLIPTVGIAFTDVVVDALMVEEGQPRGLTGTLQSVQWGTMYAAMILTGWLGGVLSGRGMQTTGFLICGLSTFAAFGIVLWFVREQAIPGPRGTLGDGLGALVSTVRDPTLVLIGAFLFLVNFNPFGTSVSYVHMTTDLRLGEEVYGRMVSVQAIAAVVAAGIYGWICRRIRFEWLVHACVAGSVACTLMWTWLADEGSAMAIGGMFGFTLMFVGLVQLDLAARYCPPAIAATVFAILMSLTNLSAALAEGIGGTLYARWSPTLGGSSAFTLLVVVGAASTGVAWVLVPALNRRCQSHSMHSPSHPPE